MTSQNLKIDCILDDKPQKGQIFVMYSTDSGGQRAKSYCKKDGWSGKDRDKIESDLLSSLVKEEELRGKGDAPTPGSDYSQSEEQTESESPKANRRKQRILPRQKEDAS